MIGAEPDKRLYPIIGVIIVIAIRDSSKHLDRVKSLDFIQFNPVTKITNTTWFAFIANFSQFHTIMFKSK